MRHCPFDVDYRRSLKGTIVIEELFKRLEFEFLAYVNVLLVHTFATNNNSMYWNLLFLYQMCQIGDLSSDFNGKIAMLYMLLKLNQTFCIRYDLGFCYSAHWQTTYSQAPL